MGIKEVMFYNEDGTYRVIQTMKGRRNK